MRFTSGTATLPGRWLAGMILAASISVPGASALASGYEHLEVPATGGEPAIQLMVWTPCASTAVPVEMGPYVIHGVSRCAIAGSDLPLVVMSHGQGGTLLGHHDTAAALADAGFVAVTFNHPGDTFGDDSGAQRLGIFESRPRDASRVISFMLETWPSRQHLDPAAVGVLGFSRGGYTALALAGAKPNVETSAERLCSHWRSFTMPLCRQFKGKQARLDSRADPRVRAAVVMDPLNLFDASGLKPVRIPVQLWASEQGGDGVELTHVEALRSELPRSPEYHLAKGAGHFAYLAPCPPEFKASARRICEDPEGFDRSEWHRDMNAAVVRFFRQHL